MQGTFFAGFLTSRQKLGLGALIVLMTGAAYWYMRTHPALQPLPEIAADMLQVFNLLLLIVILAANGFSYASAAESRPRQRSRRKSSGPRNCCTTSFP